MKIPSVRDRFPVEIGQVVDLRIPREPDPVPLDKLDDDDGAARGSFTFDEDPADPFTVDPDFASLYDVTGKRHN